jgi:predicted  nucleic acid-binding Zn ribbon protein
MTPLDRLQIRNLHPDDNICKCAPSTAALLRYGLTEFPLFCLECTGQLFPSAFTVSPELAAKIVEWRDMYSSLYHLWLASSSYEEFAKQALSDVGGEVNRLGMALASELGAQRPTYYWWFRPDPMESFSEACPRCESDLTPHHSKNFGFCDTCRIAY